MQIARSSLVRYVVGVMAWCEGEGRPRANQAAGARSDGAVLRVPSLAPVEEEELGPIPSHDEVVVRSKLKDGLVGAAPLLRVPCEDRVQVGADSRLRVAGKSASGRLACQSI